MIDRIPTLFQQALELHRKQQFAQARELYEEILASIPDHYDALHLSGVVALQVKDHRRAVDLIGQAISFYPYNPTFYFNLGLALHQLNQLAGALGSYDKAIELDADYAEAWSNRGLALHGLKQFSEAVVSYDHAIRVKPDFAAAWYNRGNALHELNQLVDAIGSYDRAIELHAEYAEAWSNRGVALYKLSRLNEALKSYDNAIKLKPDYAEACFNRGKALKDLKQLDAAVLSYDSALEINPEYAEAWYNRGNALQELKMLDAALVSYEKALSINPGIDYLLGAFLYLRMMICDWTSIDVYSRHIATKIVNRERPSNPFHILAVISSISTTKSVAMNYIRDKHPPCPTSEEMIKRSRRDKIRIGYYSADFHNHATMFLMVELFEKHDRSKFEIIAFSFGPDQQDDIMRKRAVSAFDHFIDVRTKTANEVALLSRDMEIDIAIDLKGFTTDSRTDIFSYRAAPIQVNYLGYPGTMGAEYIDYLVADQILIPKESQKFYSEKIVYLPNSYQVNDAKRQISDKVYNREELGLPATGFVFCCFNNNYKITPDTFDCWMRILKSIQGSVLWLLEDNPQAAVNLRKEAVRRGVDADRLVFAKRMLLPEHLARHRSADLFLDTLPCNAHTTASDALWAGLPVLTCIGESFAGRVAASLLNAIHLPELITDSQAEYEAMAIELAVNPEKLGEIRLRLQQNRLSSPLFDSDLFTRHIEAAYTEMSERYHRDLPPDHIYVQQDRLSMLM